MTIRDTEVLSELRRDPELLAVADALHDALRPRRRWVRPASVVLLLALAAIASVVGLIVANASAEKHPYHGPGITPSTVAALTSERTRLSGIPEELAGETGPSAPRPGTVHVLGGGLAYAWMTESGQVCWDTLYTPTCFDHLKQPIETAVADPDVVGAGKPPQIYGIASDEVRSVTVQLDDGRSLTSDVVDNFYVIPLPDIAPPWIVPPLTVTANLEDGTATSQQLPGATRSNG
jgi:hypothetical protein